MFFGMPARIVNAKGKAIQGTLGFVGALLKIIRQTESTHIAVLFDGQHENERAVINESYKANRIDYGEIQQEDNPFGYALTYGVENEIVISSFDSDFFS